MATRPVSYGKCFLCGQTFAKNAITRHLKKCVLAHETGKGKPARLFHIRAEGYYAPEYWIHLEMPADAILADLDDFLRAIWLECCGHLSAFTIGGAHYEYNPWEEETEEEAEDWIAAEKEELLRSLGNLGMDRAALENFLDQIVLFPPSYTMDVPLAEVLSVGTSFTHEYDFGSTTMLRLKVMGERKGPRPKGGVRVLARNYAPVFPCVECSEPSRWVYVFGDYETYCDRHAQAHDDWREGFLPLVNSPRAGVCGYTGPSRRSLKFEETVPEKAEK